ncbi:MAG: hypothetical protein ACYTHK_07300 [Planctomycetota bacterium]|jgi:hypothetical protein
MRLLALILVLLSSGPALAQERLLTAGEALDKATCQQVSDSVRARIEKWTRLKYRRSVPVDILSQQHWRRMLQAGGVAGNNARRGLAFYNIISNQIRVVPWVMGRYPPLGKNPIKKYKDEWVNQLESIIIHELMHALHHQNFYVVLGGARAASVRTGGLTADQKDISTVEFLRAEGTAELVAVRTATAGARPNLTRRPNRELDIPQRYWDTYQPDNKRPFRVILSNFGYQHGLDILNRLDRRAGPRAIRALLYRQPPREVFFNPDLMAKMVDFDDPPDPDSILTFLSPDGVKFGEVHLAVWPGKNRFFSQAMPGPGRNRAPGCLIGYYASVGDEDADMPGRGNYSMFVADPDKPGTWSKEQKESLLTTNPGGTKQKRVELPLTDGVKADLISVKREDGSIEMRAEVSGLVICARETKPTPNLEERVVLALRSLYIRRPKPGVYDAAMKEAAKRIKKDKGD